MSKGYVIFSIIQSALLVVVIIIAIVGIKSDVSVEKINYDRILGDNEKVIHKLKEDMLILKEQAQTLIYKVDSVKSSLPRYEKNLISIKAELKTLNNAKISNYTDSTAAAILRRLSR